MRTQFPAVLIAFYISATAALADQRPEWHTADAHIAAERWDWMCESLDCSQFPYGYLTLDMGGRRFYLPYNATMGLEQDAGFWRNNAFFGRGSGAQFTEEGLEVRSYLETDWLVFHEGFLGLVTWYGIDLPTEASTSWSHAIFRTRPAYYDGDLAVFAMGGTSETRIPKSVTDVSDADVVRYSDRFWMLADGPNPIVDTIMTREPVVNGMHLVGKCRGLFCDFLSWPQERESELPQFTLELRNYRVQPSGRCLQDEQNPGRMCPAETESLDRVIGLARGVLEMLEVAQNRPAQGANANIPGPSE